MTTRTAATEILRSLVAGDLAALRQVGGWADGDVLAAANGEPLMVTRAAVIRVLRDLDAGGIDPEAARRWASFVRRGYLPSAGRSPVQPIDIGIEAAYEEAIIDAVGRLDELGDAVDGELSPDELRALIRTLEADG
jgi:hypothetical protein